MAASFRGAFLVMSALSLVVLISFPVSAHAQMVLSAGAILAMLVFWPLRTHRAARYVFLALGSVIVLRYLFWRTSQTLPAFSDTADFSVGLILLVAEIFCITLFFISLFIVVDPLVRPDAPILDDDDLPSVDVFVPSYNEDSVLLASTLSAAKALDYPAAKLNVFLLDDGGTDEKCSQADPQKAANAQARRRELQALAAQLDVHYVARERNVHAKAGNLNAGLAVSRGELVVVFDADHAPVREFLRKTVGYFAQDPKLFLVQTPHVFLNPDPVEKNLGTWAHMPSENEQFYSVVQCGLDRWNAAFFCGSAAVLRREALNDVGGFSGITITEDCETALELHAKGWSSLYVDTPLIGGLQPESFADFIGQRSRWCRGMMQILILKNPLLKKGLSLPQRVGYLSSSLFWAFPFPRLIFTIAPLFFIFFEMRIYVATTLDFFAYTVNYILVALMLQNYLFSRVRWPWVSELYEFLQSPFLVRDIVSVIANPRKPTFNVTAKNTTLTQDHFSAFAMPFVVMFAVLLAAMILVAFQIYDDASNNDLLYVVAGWNAFNLTLAAVSLGAVTERKALRRTHRISSHHKAILSVGGKHVPVIIHDVSIGGLSMTPIGNERLGMQTSQQMGTLAFLRAPVSGAASSVDADGQPIKPPVERLSVMLRRIENGPQGVEIGAQFINMEAPQFVSVAYLMYGSAEPLAAFLKHRRKGKSILGGTFNLMRWGLIEPLRAARLFVTLRRRRPVVASQRQNAEPLLADLSYKLGLREVAEQTSHDAASLSRPAPQGQPKAAKAVIGVASIAALLLVWASGLPTDAHAQSAYAPQARQLHALPFGQSQVRFVGETAQRSFWVYLPATMATRPLAFQFAPTSSISVMPETSWMHVQINGTPLAPARLGTDRATTLQQRPVGPGMVQPGWNHVALSVDQRHRVDCSFPATFELWSDLNAQSTGFVSLDDQTAGRQSGVASLDDLLAVPVNAAGREPLNGVLPRQADEGLAQALARSMAHLALALGMSAPQVTLSDAPIDGALNVQLQSTGTVNAGAYGLAFDEGALVVTLGGAVAEHWAQASRQLRDDLRAYANTAFPVAYRALDGRTRFTLADLGLASQEFAGRHFSQSFTLDLPLDYFASDVGRAEIRLAGGYVAGLAESAELSVQVNGTIAASIPLDAASGEVFSDRSLYIDLGHFRPGRNEVAIVADVSHVDDTICDADVLASQTPRFLLLDDTQIIFPSFARLGQLPAITPGLGHHLVGRRGQTLIHVPHPDQRSLAAATALQVRMALDMGNAEGVSLTYVLPTSDGSRVRGDNAILVAALQDLPLRFGMAVDLPMDTLALAWGPVIEAPQMPGVDPMMTASTGLRIVGDADAQPLPSGLATGVPAVAPAMSDLSDAGQQAWPTDPVERRIATLRQELATRHQPDVDPQTTASIGSGLVPPAPLQRPGQMTREDQDAMRARWQDSVEQTSAVVQSAAQMGRWLQTYVTNLIIEPTHMPDISAQADLVIQQIAASDGAHTPLTVITASQPARLDAAMQSITAPHYWNQLSGSRAVFSESEQRLDVSHGLAEAHFVVTQPTSISNWRLVLAGYYSNNPLLYTLAILLIAPGLGIVGGRAIRRSGQVEKDDASETEGGAHA